MNVFGTKHGHAVCVRPVHVLACVAVVAMTARSAVIVSAKDVIGDLSAPCSDAIQRLIDTNPNREIFFPDGIYLLDKPICTPADPRHSVSLRLSNYAVFRATPSWTNVEAMVRLGGICPANDIRTVGSCYFFEGGVLDGAGRAIGLSIDSGRETKVQDVSMKNVTMGIHIKHGANSNSSDADISDVNIVGADPESSVGVWVESNDNTLSKMRIASVKVGVKLTGGGNLLSRIHPLCTGRMKSYDEGVGFLDFANGNHYDVCYSDHFSVGFRLRGTAVLHDCIVWWYAPNKGMPHTAIRCDGPFNSLVTNLQIGFRDKDAVNTVLQVGKDGGKGFLWDVRVNESLIRPEDTVFRSYLRGSLH